MYFTFLHLPSSTCTLWNAKSGYVAYYIQSYCLHVVLVYVIASGCGSFGKAHVISAV